MLNQVQHDERVVGALTECENPKPASPPARPASSVTNRQAVRPERVPEAGRDLTPGKSARYDAGAVAALRRRLSFEQQPSAVTPDLFRGPAPVALAKGSGIPE